MIKAAGAIHHDARLVARLDRAAVEEKKKGGRGEGGRERIGYPRPGDNLYCFSRSIPRSCLRSQPSIIIALPDKLILLNARCWRCFFWLLLTGRLFIPPDPRVV